MGFGSATDTTQSSIPTKYSSLHEVDVTNQSNNPQSQVHKQIQALKEILSQKNEQTKKDKLIKIDSHKNNQPATKHPSSFVTAGSELNNMVHPSKGYAKVPGSHSPVLEINTSFDNI